MGQNPLGESYPFSGGFGPTSFVLVSSVKGDLLGRVRPLEAISQEEADKEALSVLVAMSEPDRLKEEGAMSGWKKIPKKK